MAAAPASLDDAPATLRGSALLVEDHPVNQSVATGMLRKLGLRCELAENGAVALDRVREQDFDLVVMDCQMPVMDGYEAAASIGALPGGRGARPPIVALTANPGPEDAARCRAAGMDDFIAKPFSLVAMRTALSRWLAAETTPQDPTNHDAPAVRDAVAASAAAPAVARMAAIELERWGSEGRMD